MDDRNIKRATVKIEILQMIDDTIGIFSAMGIYMNNTWGKDINNTRDKDVNENRGKDLTTMSNIFLCLSLLVLSQVTDLTCVKYDI